MKGDFKSKSSKGVHPNAIVFSALMFLEVKSYNVTAQIKILLTLVLRS